MFGDKRVGVNICEDIWYPGGPARLQSLVGDAQLIVNISASPYHAGKSFDRGTDALHARAEDNAVALAYATSSAARTNSSFDGNSLIHRRESGHVVAQGAVLRPGPGDRGHQHRTRSSPNGSHDPRRRREKGPRRRDRCPLRASTWAPRSNTPDGRPPILKRLRAVAGRHRRGAMPRW